MSIFNSYVVFDKEGNLIAHERSTEGTSGTYFYGLPADIQRRARVMIVLQEQDYVARYKVTQPSVPAPTLGAREDLGDDEES